MRLTKHHGLGNDFLVLVDLEARVEVDGAMARALCDRRRGVGADGLIHAGPAEGADVTMVLRNADGGRAEMSGNGARCLGQALAMVRGLDRLELDVATDAGVRRVTVAPGEAPRTVWATVDMGPAEVRGIQVPPAGRAAEVDVGNPHLVLMGDGPTPDLLALGPSRPDVNVEVVWQGPAAGELSMRVRERGVGETLACGTGACAAAAAARSWDLVGDAVTVHMPGGDALVALADTVTLAGPSVYVATVEVPWP